MLAVLLGLLRVQEIHSHSSEQPTFRYSFRKANGLVVEEVQLGDELHAIDLLYRDRRADHQSDRHYLLRQIEEVIQTLSVQLNLPIYALLIEFYMQVVYPPQQDRLEDREVTLVQYSPEYAVLDLARSHLERKLTGEQERSQMRTALEQLRGKALGEPLDYDEYLAALGPYTKASGKVETRFESEVGIERAAYRDALVLDLARIDPRYRANISKKTPARKAQTAVSPATDKPRRPCPECHEEIDARAIYCTHCSQTVAEHVTCEHCGEARVPNDLSACWKCGMALPQTEELIECPRCFSYSGPLESFPCHECGYDFNGSETGDRSASFESPADETAPPPSPDPEPAAPVLEQIECPTCFEQVDAAAQCSVCGGLLG